MKKLAGLLALVTLGMGGLAGQQGQPGQPRLRLLVPAYFYPAGDGLKHWDNLLAAAPEVPILAIVNPASGPGQKPDPNYTRVLARARQTPLTLLGYVATGYAKRPVKDVKQDVDTWLRFYPGLKGIFFDEQASGGEHVAYYGALYDHVRQARGLRWVVNNPGTVCTENFFARPALDVGCLYEGLRGLEKFMPPDWARKYSPARAAALFYGVPPGGMRAYVRGALDRGVGVVYVTDAGGANPWDRLPSYWGREVALVREINGR